MKLLRAGTRGSDLALRQTRLVAEELRSVFPDVQVEPVIITTTGDRIQDRSLADAGGKGLFVQELEEAMKTGKIDFAVHSGKDLPSETPNPFIIASVSEREDPSDLLVSIPNREISIVGTSSQRRAMMIRKMYPECEIKLLRGNVPTRIRKLREEKYDAILLASAGVKRLQLDLSDLSVRALKPDEMVPASCQGIMACEALKGSEAESLLVRIDHKEIHFAFDLERRFMQLLGADCHDAAGVFSKPSAKGFTLYAFYKTPVIHKTIIQPEKAEQELELFAKELKL